MRLSHIIAVVASVTTLVEAWNAPQYPGYTRRFQSNFIGPKGNQPDQKYWRYIRGDKNDNNEFQRYTSNKDNLQLTGSKTLQIVPRRNPNTPKGWTSARIESKYLVSPAPGKITRVESSIRVGLNDASHKKGIWPAFWMMGNSFRNGVPWPQSGEVDIFENINGEKRVYGVAHCGSYPNGPCNEPIGLVNTTPLNDGKFHVYRVEFDRRNSNFRQQSINWYKDGKRFNRITGAQINNANVWASLCQKPMYMIINVAVGGDWPGNPNKDTWGGNGSQMELGYVAHYTSN